MLLFVLGKTAPAEKAKEYFVLNQKYVYIHSMPAKKQFKMYIESDTLGHLDAAAEQFGRSSAQSVVEELIKIYLPVWVSINDALAKAVNYQSELSINEPQQGKTNSQGSAPSNTKNQRKIP